MSMVLSDKFEPAIKKKSVRTSTCRFFKSSYNGAFAKPSIFDANKKSISVKNAVPE